MGKSSALAALVQPRRAGLAALATVLVAAAIPHAADAAPRLRASSKAATPTTAYDLTIAVPGGVVPGDVMLAVIGVRRQAEYLASPAGWQLVRVDESNGSTLTFTKALYVKVAGSFEPASYTWQFKYSAGAAGAILAYAGVDTGAPVAGHGGAFSANTSSIRAPSVTTPVSGALIVGLFGSSGDGATTPPSGMTERFDASTPDMYSDAKSEGADAVQAAAGATGDRIATTSAANSSNVGQLVALRPLATSGGDATPPSAPAGVTVGSRTQSTIALTWQTSTDNVGVAGYGLYRDGALVATTTSTGFTFSGLACGTSYTLGVDAYDAAGNRSGRTSTTASTAACSGGSLGRSLPPPLPESAGTTFYVSTSGSDSNPGTAAAPWRTIQKALSTLQPGQRAYVRAGTYVEDLRLTRAGTASAPITVEAYPGEKPVLASSGGHPLRVESTGAYFRFRGFAIEKHPGTSGGNVDVYGHHLEISRNEIRLGTDQGIYSDEGSHHVQILANWIHHNGKGITHQSHGIYLQGDDHLVASNVIHDHPFGFGIQVYDRNSRSVLVNNTITSSKFSGVVVGGPGGVDNITIRNNVLAFNTQYGVGRDSTCPDGPVLVDHNVIWGNGSGAVQSGCSQVSTSGGNTLADPRFVDYGRRDLHLAAGSPALGTSVPDWTPTTDRDGKTRPQGSGPDIGAYES